MQDNTNNYGTKILQEILGAAKTVYDDYGILQEMLDDDTLHEKMKENYHKRQSYLIDKSIEQLVNGVIGEDWEWKDLENRLHLKVDCRYMPFSGVKYTVFLDNQNIGNFDI